MQLHNPSSEMDPPTLDNLDILAHFQAIRQTQLQHERPSRTAMGAYVVPPGGKTLTSLGDNIPAPSDYFPKVDLTKRAAPHYSMTGRYKVARPDYQASPADNDTSKDMEWCDRKISLKGRTRPYERDEIIDEDISADPARYKIDYKDVGAGGPKCSIARRHRVNVGPPNHLVQPVDTHGFTTPGPDYRPNLEYFGRGPKKSFGSSRPPAFTSTTQDSDESTGAPGPAAYTVKDHRLQGPAYSLAKRLPPPHIWQQAVKTTSPGPAHYDLGTTVGKAQAKSIGARHGIKPKLFGPAPNLYSLPDTISNAPTATLTHRPYEQKAGPHPGATEYTISKANLPRAAAYSIRKNCQPSFPDILNYPLIGRKHSNPGPNRYEENRTLAANDKPKFSMGKRASPHKNAVPGPNHYNIKVGHTPNLCTAPAFSMGSRLELINKHVSPGPAAYLPGSDKLDSHGYSMTKRPKAGTDAETPAANAYTLANGQTNRGVNSGLGASFKGRASPYIYSGFRSTVKG